MIGPTIGIFSPLFLASVCAAASPGQPGALVPSLLAMPRARADVAAPRSAAGNELANAVLPTPPLRSVELRPAERQPIPRPPVTPPPVARPAQARLQPSEGMVGMHPAVVRVVAPGQGSVSYGSGTLVDVNGAYGLVITNYHVINEATGNISVVFPDGFYSLATVRKIDRDWDLAALSIKRPGVAPVKVAPSAPQPGEPLTIAGYGSGNYRAVAGRCTQYVAPGTQMPFEMVELAASARQGDSGGPILNSRGELAGVLFGEGGGRTAGSYCGRVKWFLESLVDRPELRQQASDQPEQIAVAPQERLVAARSPAAPVPRDSEARAGSDLTADVVLTTPPPRQFSPPRIRTPVPEHLTRGLDAGPIRTSLAPPVENLDWSELAGTTVTDQAKTFLAILGCCALLMLSLKALGGETSGG